MNSSADRRKPNRLIHENSPYLLQHAYNPVDWYPWGEEAFAAARTKHRPIFLSIGYAACHWCHVMEEEVFENPAAAELLNQHFICVKVDREERPDVDAIYMNAVQLLTGHGGWPLSVFLTPELMPFYGGTYFPWNDRPGLPGFATVLARIAERWQKNPGKLRQIGEDLTQTLRENLSFAGEKKISELHSLTEAATQWYKRKFDTENGGFDGAPKFPPAQGLAFLLRQYASSGDESLWRMVNVTLEKMAAGGIHDQLGGGFHRYSVDAEWLTPHFEKMLYDNALLADVYTEAFLVSGNAEYRRTATAILDYLLREMRDSGGAFYAAEDADSEGEEGRFYTWTHEELQQVLPAQSERIFCEHFGVTGEGNFEGRNILSRGRSLEEIAATEKSDCAALKKQIDEAVNILFEKRSQRPRPVKDDKIITAWNAMTISALAKASQAYGDQRYLDAAQKAMAFILREMGGAQDLKHMYRSNKSQGAAFLDDYALLAKACLDLYESDLNLNWYDQAELLCDVMFKRFQDEKEGGFYFSDQRDLVARDKPFFDSPVPSGNAAAVEVLQRLSKYREHSDYEQKSTEIICYIASAIQRYPAGFAQTLINIQRHFALPLELTIAGHRNHPDVITCVRAVHTEFLPFKVLALVDPAKPESAEAFSFTSPSQLSEKPKMYICENYSCREPIEDPEVVVAELRYLASFHRPSNSGAVPV